MKEFKRKMLALLDVLFSDRAIKRLLRFLMYVVAISSFIGMFYNNGLVIIFIMSLFMIFVLKTNKD